MGIKFNCPNGHKLNVKSFLAGKKGVCPHCGAKFRIPNEPGDEDDDLPAPLAPPGTAPPLPMGVPADSHRGRGGANGGCGIAGGSSCHRRAGGHSDGHARAAARDSGGADGNYAADGGASRPPGCALVGVPVGGVATGIPLPVGGPLVGAPLAGGAVPMAGPPAARIPPAPLPDPIAEAPAAVWYVRPPTGSQYGPARGDVMRKWITEGRVSGDSLVWREGWPDWKNAAQLFPNLGGGAGGTAGPPPGPLGDLPITSRAARTTARLAAKKKGSSGLAIAALVLLGLVCLILVGVLVAIFANQ